MPTRGIERRAGDQVGKREGEKGGRFAQQRCVSLSPLLPFLLSILPLLWFPLLVIECTNVAAADKSGVTPNTISLPSGPGSIEGLGEAFQPSLNTGTAKYGVGLRLPPGTARHAPSLSLRYEGGSGNGPVGFGWNLPVPYIQRQCDKGIPRYIDDDNQLDDDRDGETDEYDERDVFINEMKEELVPQANGYFFCENEGAFIRYRRNGDHWEGTLPNGSRLEFGLTPAARGHDATTNRIFRWLLERSTDTHGNTIVYSYRSFTGDSNLNQKYLAAIRYGSGGPPWANFHFAAFAYEDRPDWFEDCRSGFIIRTGKRLKEIVIGTQCPTLAGHLGGDFDGDGNTDYLARKYQLDYLRYAGTNSHWSLLAKVLQVGANGTNSLPPATFGYAVCDPPALLSASGGEIGGVNEPPFVMDNELADLVDLNGDGLPDILKTESGGGAHAAYLNRGEVTTNGVRAVRWGAAAEVASADGLAWNVDLGSANDVAHLADMDGDGIADLTYKSAIGDVFYFANGAQLSWKQRQSMSIQDATPPSPFGDPQVRTADIDFDKRIDIVQSISVGDGAEYRIWFNLGQQRYARSLTVPQTSGFLFSQAGVHLVDFNGDRVPDVVRLRSANLTVTAGLGHGQFADPIIVPIPDPGLEDTQVAVAKLEDITGDGLADLVLERAEPGHLWYWLNLGNYAFGPRKVISGMPSSLGLQPAIRWADLNGNGTSDLIYADSQSSPRLRTVDIGELLGCVPGHNVLTNVANGIGRVTGIEYRPSTRFALDDAAAGNPWPDVMPFPLSVVSAVITSDSLGHQYVTRYRYHNGYYDGVEKEFRGFARVEQIDVGDATAPTLVTRFHFDTGRQHEALKGKVLRQTAEQEDGKVFWDETTMWTTPPKILMTGLNAQVVQYAHPTATARRVIELGQGEERLLETECAYDNFGNKTRNANYGIVVNGDRSAFDDERVITTEYAVNTNAWLIRFASRSEVQDEDGATISRTETFYDDPTFGGANLGEVSAGDTTLVRNWIDPGIANAFVNSSRIHYDVYGNPIRFLDPLAVAPGGVVDASKGHCREIFYDADFHAYPEREIIHVGNGRAALTVEAGYDKGFGTAIRSLDFNGHETSYGYDVFARLTRMIRPGDTAAYPTVEYQYALAVPFGNNHMVNYVETRALDKAPGSAGNAKRDHYLIGRQFTDGMGRNLLTKGETEPAAGSNQPRVVVSGAVLFNARAGASVAFGPFFSVKEGADLDTLLEFENVGQPGWQGLFHDRGEMKMLDLAAAHQIRSICDALLRTKETVNPDGTRARVIREPLVERSLDENDTDAGSLHFNTPHVYHRDGLGRQIRTDELVWLNDDGTSSAQLTTWSTRFEYDLNDRLTRITDSQGNVKTMAHDGLQRITFVDDPNCGVTRYQHDEASNLIETRDAKDQQITYTYDGVNRLLSEDYHDENQPYSFGYRYNPAFGISQTNRPDVAYFHDEPFANLDLGDGTVGAAANTKGQLAYTWDLSGEEHASFDARGRTLWTVKRTVDPVHTPVLHGPVSSSALVSYRTQYAHDSLDRLIRLVYPDNDQVEHSYDDRGQLITIAGNASGPLVTFPEYLPSSQPVQMRCGNGIETNYEYDNRLRLRSLVTRPPGGNPEYIHLQYELDPASNFLAIHDKRPGAAVPSGHARRNTQFFAYDNLNRLTRVQYSFRLSTESVQNDGEINYRYDRIGNMVGQTSSIHHEESEFPVANLGQMDSGGAAGRWNRAGRAANDPPGPHALTSVTQTNSPLRVYSYDDNGNMLSIDGLTCTWDFKDRLVVAENNQMRAEYVYDGADRRIVKRVEHKPSSTNRASRLTTLYISKYFEVREHNQPVKYVWKGETRVARVTGSLSSSDRLQRLRVFPGWNLVSLAVYSTNTAAQLQQPLIETLYRWNAVTTAHEAVQADDDLPAGTVLWIKAAGPGTLTLRGTYPAPADLPIAVGGSYYTGAGLEALPTRSVLDGDASVWFFTPDAQEWLTHLTGELDYASEFPEFLSPGEAVFINAETPDILRVPDANLLIRFYHQDHLGSSSVITDMGGNLVEETSFFPFGVARTEHRPRNITEDYRFTQKERDKESGLNYFEARYLRSQLARFLTTDPLVRAPHSLGAQANPQVLHPYSYALNSPLRFIDPTGKQPFDQEPSQILVNALGDEEAYRVTEEAEREGGARAAEALVGLFNPLETFNTAKEHAEMAGEGAASGDGLAVAQGIFGAIGYGVLTVLDFVGIGKAGKALLKGSGEGLEIVGKTTKATTALADTQKVPTAALANTKNLHVGQFAKTVPESPAAIASEKATRLAEGKRLTWHNQYIMRAWKDRGRYIDALWHAGKRDEAQDAIERIYKDADRLYGPSAAVD